MKAENYWSLFLETGAPEAYSLFNIARRMEDKHVFDSPGACITDNGLQRT